MGPVNGAFMLMLCIDVNYMPGRNTHTVLFALSVDSQAFLRGSFHRSGGVAFLRKRFSRCHDNRLGLCTEDQPLTRLTPLVVCSAASLPDPGAQTEITDEPEGAIIG